MTPLSGIGNLSTSLKRTSPDSAHDRGHNGEKRRKVAASSGGFGTLPLSVQFFHVFPFLRLSEVDGSIALLCKEYRKYYFEALYSGLFLLHRLPSERSTQTSFSRELAQEAMLKLASMPLDDFHKLLEHQDPLASTACCTRLFSSLLSPSSSSQDTPSSYPQLFHDILYIFLNAHSTTEQFSNHPFFTAITHLVHEHPLVLEKYRQIVHEQNSPLHLELVRCWSQDATREANPSLFPLLLRLILHHSSPFKAFVRIFITLSVLNDDEHGFDAGPLFDFLTDKLHPAAHDQTLITMALKQKWFTFKDLLPKWKTNTDVVIVAMRACSTTEEVNQIARSLSDTLLHEPKFARALVSIEGAAEWLGELSPRLQSDYETVLCAARSNGFSILHASLELLNCKEILREAVVTEPRVLHYVSNPNIFCDRDLALRSLQYDEDILELFSPLTDDSEFVLLCMKRFGTSFRFASERLRSDLDTVKNALQIDASSLQFVKFQLLEQHPELVLLALKRCGDAIRFLPQDLMEKVPESLSRAWSLAALDSSAMNLQYVHHTVKNDRNVVLKVVSQEGYALKWAASSLRDDYSICLAAVTNDPEALDFVPAHYLDSKQLLIAALKGGHLSPEILHNSSQLLSDPDVIFAIVDHNASSTLEEVGILECLKNLNSRWKGSNISRTLLFRTLRLAPKLLKNFDLKKDWELALYILEQDGMSLQYFSPEFRDCFDLVYVAVCQNGCARQYASPRLQQSKLLLVKSIQNRHLYFGLFAPSLIIPRAFTSDEEVMLNIIQSDPIMIWEADGALLLNHDFLVRAVSVNSKVLPSLNLEHFSEEETRNIISASFPSCYFHQLNPEWFDLDGGKENYDRALELVRSKVEGLAWFESLWKKEHPLRHGVVMEALRLYPARYRRIIQKRLDKASILNLLRHDGMILQYISEEEKNNREFVYAAVQSRGKSLRYASQALRKDRGIVMTAIQQNGEAIAFADMDLLCSAGDALELYLCAVNQKGGTLNSVLRLLSGRSISEEDSVSSDTSFSDTELPSPQEMQVGSRSDDRKQIVWAAIKQDGLALRYCNEVEKNDVELVLSAIQNNVNALAYAGNALKNNKNFIVQAAHVDGSAALRFASENLRCEYAVLEAACENDGMSLEMIPLDKFTEEQQRRLILKAVRENGNALSLTSAMWRGDKEIVLAAVQENSQALVHAEAALWNSAEFMQKAVLVAEGDVIRFSSREFLRDHREIVCTALRNSGTALRFIHAEDRSMEYCRVAVASSTEALEYVGCGSDVASDRELMLGCLKRDSEALVYASEALRSDKEFVAKCVAEEAHSFLDASPSLTENKDFFDQLCSINEEVRMLAK